MKQKIMWIATNRNGTIKICSDKPYKMGKGNTPTGWYIIGGKEGVISREAVKMLWPNIEIPIWPKKPVKVEWPCGQQQIKTEQ